MYSQMLPTATDVHVPQSVCAGYINESCKNCKNGRNNQDAVWRQLQCGLKEPRRGTSVLLT